MDRARLKSAGAALLDALAQEHPVKHQASKARRYIMRSKQGAEIELIFEQGEGSPPHLWVEERFAPPFSHAVRTARSYPASQLYSKPGADGQPSYGRHSSLESMPRLGRTDLLRLTPSSLEELGRLLDGLVEARP